PQSSKDVVANDAGKKTNEEPANEGERNGQEKAGGASNKENDQNVQDFRAELDNLLFQQKKGYANSTNRDSTVSPSVSTAGKIFTNTDDLPTDPLIPDLEDTGIFSSAYNDKDMGAEADLNNMETTMNVSPIPITRIHKDHPKDQIIRDINSATQTRRMTKISEEHAMARGLFRTKWVYRNKKDERRIIVRNKARLVAQGYTQEEGINYDEVFAPVARIEAIRLFLAYASFIGLIVYQMDVKSAFLYGTIEEEVAWYETLSTYLLENRYRRGIIDKTLFIKKDRGLQVQQKEDGIFISQDKYVADILKKFDFTTVKAASTPIETNKALNKDEEAEDVDVHLYRLMIGSLMYLTASRPDIMFVVCACARFQVTPKTSHLHAVKRIFRYLKGQPKLGLWYPRDSPFDLEAFSDSDYAGASLDRKSTIRGCQFLGKRLISWQCKKQTIVANSTTEAEYVAAANCCGQVLWIQNQMLDYGFNFINTKIYIDNESTICIVKNLVFHSKTKHIEIRHHFIRDSYEKKLIQVIKIHTDHNVADLLTKAFDVSRYLLGRERGRNAQAVEIPQTKKRVKKEIRKIEKSKHLTQEEDIGQGGTKPVEKTERKRFKVCKARIDADYELAVEMHKEEQEKYTNLKNVPEVMEEFLKRKETIAVLFLILLDNLRNRSRFGINKWYQSFALRNFDLEDMEFESTNSGTNAKLPILKLGEYEIPQTTQENDTSVTKMSIPVTAEEKTNKKNNVKARGLLLMTLPNEHQLTFSQYPDAKSMFVAIETRFGESLDSIFNRLQKIVSRLAILGMNKPEVETLSIDDLYNNFKIVEQKVKKSVGTSSGAQNMAFMTTLSTSSTNDANTASPQVSTTSVSDNTMYAFMVKNPNGSNVLHQDIEQIHEDDLEAMDLKWQLSLLNDLEQIHEDDLEAMDLTWQLSLLNVRASH
ncbi:putative ribonuclease H-like domain-containing protein, partial [Tanacetum coccineum]